MTAVIGSMRAPRRTRARVTAALLTRRAVTHAKTVAKRLSGSALTAAGLGLIDVGAFEAHPIAGWFVTGVTVLLLDWKLE